MNNKENMQENKTDNEIVTEMKRHLASKYGSLNYKTVGFIRGGWDHEYDLLNLSIEIDGIEEPLYVERHVNENGECEYKDNYFGYLVRDEFESKISECANKYFDEYKIFAGMDTTTYPNSLIGSSSLEDMYVYNEQLNSIVVFVIVDGNNMNKELFYDMAEKAEKELEEMGYNIFLRIIKVEKSVYRETQRNNYLDVIRGDYMEYEPEIEGE